MAVQDVPSPLVHKVSMETSNDTRKAKTRLDEVFDEREARAAQRFSAAELEKMAIESENEVARLRGEPPKYKYSSGGEIMNDEEKKKADEKQAAQQEKITTQAIALISSGMPAAQVGQMLMGLTPTGTTPMPAQGMGLDDVLKIVNLVVGKKEADELKDVIADLSRKVTDITKNPPHKEETKPLDPISFAKAQAEAVLAWNEALEKLRPAPAVSASSGGESIEVVKEKNRHAEKMEEIHTDRDYKQGLVEVVGEIPENIGRGIGQQFSESHDDGGGGGELLFMTCTEEGCGTKIHYPPGTKEITCPKCHALYAAEGTTAESGVK